MVDKIMMSWPTYVFNESTFVLEGVTLGEVVELVVEVLVDLASSTVLDKKAAEDSQTAHPEDLAVYRISKFVPRMLSDCFLFSSSVRFRYRVRLLVVMAAYLGIRASLVPFLLPKPR